MEGKIGGKLSALAAKTSKLGVFNVPSAFIVTSNCSKAQSRSFLPSEANSS